MEALVDFCKQSIFMPEMYANFDCDITCGNIFEDLGNLLSKSVFPVNCPLSAMHILALEGNAGGFLFECHIDMKEVMGITKWHSLPVKCLKYSSSLQYIISGHDDGVVRIQTAPTPGQLSVMQQHIYWEGRAHDGFTGAVGGAMISFDHQYLASAAYDGSVYIHELQLEKPKQFVDKPVEKPERAMEDEVKDVGVGVYSIEEDKRKTEQDNKLRIALENKNKVKERVEVIRSRIAQLLKENNDRDVNERLPLEDFEVDPNIRSMIEDEIQKKISDVKQELEWESEKKSIALSKLRRLFLDPLEIEYVVLHAFRTSTTVTTFRTIKLDSDLLAAINEANAQKERPPAPRVSVLTMLKDPEDILRYQNVVQNASNDNEEQHLKGEDSAALQDMRRLQLKKMVAEYEDYVQGKQDKDIEEHCENLKRLEEMQKAQEKKGLDFGGISKTPKPEEKGASVQFQGTQPALEDSRRKDLDKLQQRMTASAQPRVFPMSTLEQEEQDALQIKLKFQKSKLLEKIELMICNFDNALQELRHKRFQLEINMKRADLKMITLCQELKVLKTMQPKEEAIESRHVAKLLELAEISGKITDQDKVIEQKKQEVHALNEKKKQLMEEFEGLLGENHPAKDALFKIYVRKVKLSKGIEDEEDEDFDENMDMDDSKRSEDDFDEDEVVEVCPPGCEQELYQKVCQLRERRTVEDSLLQESNKQLEALQRERENKLKKKKGMETALASLEKEMEDFQKEKQNALNQIDTVLTLYMHQLEHLVDGKLPEDFSESLVFSNTVIAELKETIKDHGSETLALKKLQKELKKDHITLVRERKVRESKIADLEQRVTDVQMLKFGQIINLEVLDTISAKKDNDELKLQIRTQEALNAAEVAKWNKMIDDSIDQIARAMKEHAACLHVTADLQESIQLLNKNMKGKAGSPYRDVFVEKKKAELEYDDLCKVVRCQKQHIEKLKQELEAIKKERRKLFP